MFKASNHAGLLFQQLRSSATGRLPKISTWKMTSTARLVRTKKKVEENGFVVVFFTTFSSPKLIIIAVSS